MRSQTNAMPREPSLQFLGAAGTVTGSKYLLRARGRSYLVDCGIFQGDDALEQEDWRPFPVAPRGIDAVILTHAHIDHSGYLPRLVASGYEGPVYATAATIDLLGLLLPDSGRLQEEQAAYANKKGYARHLPARPLYTERDAEAALRQLRPLPYDDWTRIDEALRVRLSPAGHILGSAIVEADVEDRRVVFSGDVGRYDQDVMRDPVTPPRADVLLVESTYGDRLHDPEPAEVGLERAIRHIVKERGVLVIPSFAVGRAQHILYYLRKLQDAGRIEGVPIFLDSPMSVDATEIYTRHGTEPNLRIDLGLDDDCPIRCRGMHFVRQAHASKALNDRHGPAIIVSANGMCTGGRIRHHLKHRLPDRRNAILFVGYQAHGTLGQRLRDGARSVRIHGEHVPVEARIFRLEGLSGHADQEELMRWLGGFEEAPERTYLVHGEPDARSALARLIERELGWNTREPQLHDDVSLAAAHQAAR